MTFLALLWLPVVYLIVSFTEWYVHKYNMHKKGFLTKLDTSLYEGHAKKHHVVFSPKADEPTEEEMADIPHSMKDLLLVGTIFGLPVLLLGLILGSNDVMIGSVVLMGTSLVWGALWNWMHIRIHSTNWIPSNYILRYLKAYHDVHHHNQSKNYNSLALGWDWLMGTKGKVKM